MGKNSFFASFLRFFTVYGPYGRPDMAYFKFAVKIMNKEPIQIYNNGDIFYDFSVRSSLIAIIVLKPLHKTSYPFIQGSMRFKKILKDKQPDIVIMRDRSVYNIGVTKVCKKMGIPALLYTQSPLWEDVEGKGGAIRAFFHLPL